ncbi:MAG: hypothetical protein U0Q16_08975 [Bryobacteraceae bacterium]
MGRPIVVSAPDGHRISNRGDAARAEAEIDGLLNAARVRASLAHAVVAIGGGLADLGACARAAQDLEPR